MKTTTKILIYTLAGIFLLSGVYLVGLSALVDKKNRYCINNQSCTEKRMSECSYLRISAVGLESLGQLTGALNISTPKDTAEAGTFIYPTELEKHIRFTVEEDTLVVSFAGIKDLLSEKKAYAITNASFYYYPKHMLGVKDYTKIQLLFKDFCSKKPLQITARPAFVEFADTCELTQLYVDKAISLNLKNVRIDTLSLDLDGVKDWKVENSHILQENLFGSGDHRVYIPRSETTVMKWLPKSKKAGLSVELSGTPARLEYKE